MDAEAYRAESHDRWSRSARGWAARRDHHQSVSLVVSEWMVDAIAPQPGHRVLELAAGAGDTGFLAAELIRPGGTLITSDFAEPMLEVARARARELGVDNVEFRELEAEWIDLPTASVDAVLCRWGYMLVADPGAALRETRRVLRPGGRVALAAWDGPERNPWASIPGRLLLDRGLVAPADPEGPGMFAFAVPGRIEALLDEAGFGDHAVEALDTERSYPDLEEFLDITRDCSRPFSDVWAGLDAAGREDLLKEAARRTAPFTEPGGELRFPGRPLVAVAEA